MIAAWIDAHPQLAGMAMFGVGMVLTIFGEKETYGRNTEPDGCVWLWAILLMVCGFLGMVGIIK